MWWLLLLGFPFVLCSRSNQYVSFSTRFNMIPMPYNNFDEFLSKGRFMEGMR
jgi:hypothetical protein